MADTSIDNPAGGGHERLPADAELPVQIDTLQIDGQRPEVGDEVEFKVKGEVKRIVNDCVYVRPTEINDEPIEDASIKPANETPTADDLMSMSQQADQSGSAPGGAY
jgi:hypothetical protein